MDFGGIVQRVPSEVVRPETAGEVAAVLRRATGPVVPRGCGHSTSGQSQSDGGILLDMRGLRAVGEVRPDRVTVEAGATWREVLDATLPHGLTPPVLTDYLDLTVGGTLTIGGIGGTSHRYGKQTDNVLGMEVADPGGVIVSATLRLVPAPERVRSYTIPCENVAGLLAAQRRIPADHISGQALPGPAWRYELGAAVYDAGPELEGQVEELSYEEFADRMRPGVQELIKLGEWARPHPWAAVFLPGDRAAEVIEATLAETGPDDIGISGVVLINPLAAGEVNFSLLRTASPGAASPETMLAANEILYDRARAAGGRRYAI